MGRWRNLALMVILFGRISQSLRCHIGCSGWNFVKWSTMHWKWLFPGNLPWYPVLSFFLFFSLLDILCDLTNLIWSYGTPFEAMTGRTVFIDCLLAGVFLSRKVNARRYMHSSQRHLIITLIISWQTWMKWHSGQGPLAMNPDRCLWHSHTSVKIFLTPSDGSMDNRQYCRIYSVILLIELKSGLSIVE